MLWRKRQFMRMKKELKVQATSGFSFDRGVQNGKPRGVVALIPGFNAHSAYYAWPGEQFAASGLAAYAVDLRGRGQSDGEIRR